MNTEKYRVYLKTTKGSFTIATGSSVNGLLTAIGDWLDGPGAQIKDNELDTVRLQTLDKNGNLISEEVGPVTKRNQISKVAEELGAR